MPIKFVCYFIFLYGLAAPLAFSQEVVATGHFDLSITYEPDEGGWRTGIFDYGTNEFYPADAFIFGAGAAGKDVIPDGEPWDLVGTVGQPVWVLPEIFNADQVYLGFGTQNMRRGIFTGGLSNRGRIDIRLVSVAGSGVEAGGTLTMWQAGFPPRVHYATGDGIGADDALTNVPAGAHSHYNWAFSQPGDYAVTFEISGELTSTYGGGVVQTQVTYEFRAGEPITFEGILSSVDLGSNWRYNNTLGYFNTGAYPWIFLPGKGWLYRGPTNAAGTYFWDTELGWIWTNRNVYPSVYAFDQGNWLRF